MSTRLVRQTWGKREADVCMSAWLGATRSHVHVLAALDERAQVEPDLRRAVPTAQPEPNQKYKKTQRSFINKEHGSCHPCQKLVSFEKASELTND